MDDIDVLLSSSLKRIATPGDAAGVADAIRSRVDAGDTGTPASSSGFGGSGAFSWVPWVGVVLVVGLAGGVGGAVGAGGLLGTPIAPLPASATGVLGGHISGLDCPGGAEVASLEPGQRVLALERTDDSAYLAVRNPNNLGTTVWLPTAVVIVDEGEPAVDTLPVGGCPVVEIVVAKPAPAPAPAPGPTTEPGPGPGPAPTPDTTAPSISVGSFSPQPVYGLEAAPYCATTASVTVSATDDVGIASVSGTANTAGATVQLSSSSGSSYVFSFSAPYASGPNKIVTVTFTATDTSGNQASAPRTLVLTSAGNCLI